MKGQSAIEYLTTYGWMLITVAVVGGAVFTTIQGQGLDNSISGFSNDDVRIEKIGLSEGNGLQAKLRGATIDEAEDVGVKLNQTDSSLSKSSESTVTIPVGDTETVEIPDIARTDDTNTFDAKIKYDEGKLENLEAEGTIKGNFKITITSPTGLTATE